MTYSVFFLYYANQEPPVRILLKYSRSRCCCLNVLLSTLNAKYVHSSLALRYLAAYCRPVSPHLVVREYSINNRLTAILADLYAYQPEVVGLACYIWNIEQTLALAKMIKQVMPEVLIVLGGPEVSYQPGELLKSHPDIDYVIGGEGEESLAALLTALGSGGDFSAVRGLTWRDDRGQVFEGKVQTVAHLDDIPFPYTTADFGELKDKIMYYESSRGCPFSCQYCLSSTTRGVRFFSLERVLGDLQTFIDAGVKQVKFVDRTFNTNPDHYVPILKFLAGQRCKTNFHLEVAADCLHSEALEVLKSAPPGRFQLEIGVQSTYEPTLKAVQRHNDWPRLVETVIALRQGGNIHLHLDLIVGLPYESYQQFGISFNDVYRLQPHMLQIGFLKMLKGSGIRAGERDHGYIYSDGAPYEVLQNEYLTYGELRRLQLLEDVFNQTYNTGRFRRSLAWLVEQWGGNPFHFYEALTLYWEEQGHHQVAHSAKGVTANLLAFCAAHHQESVGLLGELLKWDALTSDGGRLRPEELPWNGSRWQDQFNRFWRDDEIAAAYIPGYVFTNWRELKRLYHIEVFSGAALLVLTEGAQGREGGRAVLFDYQGTEPSWTALAERHFWGEDESDAL